MDKCNVLVKNLFIYLIIKIHDIYNTKFVNAQEAKLVYNYKYIKEKLHKTNASMWFNKICIIEKLTPKYIHVTVNGVMHLSE
jgi:hypothetical protein